MTARHATPSAADAGPLTDQQRDLIDAVQSWKRNKTRRRIRVLFVRLAWPGGRGRQAA